MQDAELAGLKAYMADNPGAVIEDVARERKVTPRAVLEALPAGMVRIGAGEFAGAMQDIAEWGEVTLIVHTDDAIFEFTGAIPKGEVGRGYFNLMQPKGLHGHLRHERCAAIAFVERPFMGKVSAFIAFINRRRRHHVQGVRRPRRGARAARRSAGAFPRTGGPSRAAGGLMQNGDGRRPCRSAGLCEASA